MPPDPPNLRARDRAPVRPAGQPRQAVPHIAAQLQVGRKLGRLRPRYAGRRATARSMLDRSASRCESRVTTQLPRDRRRRATIRRAISRTPSFSARSRAISSARRTRRVTLDSGATVPDGIPPPSRNHRTPTASDTPSLNSRLHGRDPRLIAVQNRTRCARRPAGGRPANAPPAAPSDSPPTPSACPSQPPRSSVATTARIRPGRALGLFRHDRAWTKAVSGCCSGPPRGEHRRHQRAWGTVVHDPREPAFERPQGASVSSSSAEPALQ